MLKAIKFHSAKIILLRIVTGLSEKRKKQANKQAKQLSVQCF